MYTYTRIHVTHIHIYTFTHIHIYTYTHIRIYTYTHIHIYTYTHIHIYTYTHIHTHIHIYTYTHIHIYTYTHIHIYTYTHIHIYTYTHIHKHTYTLLHLYTYTLIHFFTYTHIHIIRCLFPVALQAFCCGIRLFGFTRRYTGFSDLCPSMVELPLPQFRPLLICTHRRSADGEYIPHKDTRYAHLPISLRDLHDPLSTLLRIEASGCVPPFLHSGMKGTQYTRLRVGALRFCF